MDYPRAGAHYPRSTGEFLAWFGTDEDCLDYLEWLRWPGGFACPHCGNAGGWRLADGRVECGDCSRRTSVTAGTIFDKTRTPLTVWFHACMAEYFENLAATTGQNNTLTGPEMVKMAVDWEYERRRNSKLRRHAALAQPDADIADIKAMPGRSVDTELKRRRGSPGTGTLAHRATEQWLTPQRNTGPYRA